MDALDLARWQFAITTFYDFLFVPITIGMSAIVAYFHIQWVRSHTPEVFRKRISTEHIPPAHAAPSPRAGVCRGRHHARRRCRRARGDAPARPRRQPRRRHGPWAPGRPRALASTDLDIAPGTHLSIAGPNGATKSTLLAVLVRHLDPLEGRYRIGDEDALALPLHRARAPFAIVDDSPHVFATTLRENLRFAAGARASDAIHDALGQAGLGPWVAALPAGLDTRLGTGGRGLSGGERARLALARARLSGCPVILLDEPVAHLDSVTATTVGRRSTRRCRSARSDGPGHAARPRR